MKKISTAAKNISTISIMLLSTLGFVILSRSDEDLTKNSEIAVLIISCLVLMPITWILGKRFRIDENNINRGIKLHAFCISALFFGGSKLQLQYGPTLTAMCNTICAKFKFIVTYVLSLFLLGEKSCFRKNFGVIIIALSLFMINFYKKENLESGEERENSLKNVILLLLSSLLNAKAFVYFNYFIRKKVNCVFQYIFITRAFELLISILYLIFVWTYLGKDAFLKYSSTKFFKRLDFYLYLVSYIIMVVSNIALSFQFDAISRLVITSVSRATIDIITDIKNNSISLFGLINYAISIIGVIIYSVNIKTFINRK